MGRGNAQHDAAVFVATVGGLGRIPWAPGTWGSVVGLALGWAVVHWLQAVYVGPLLVISFVVGALICTEAERALHRHDPPAIILDEVWGMVCVLALLPWTILSSTRLLIAFLLFRAFDITKPPPLKSLARWPKGWGIMADDLGAAVYTSCVLWLGMRLTRLF